MVSIIIPFHNEESFLERAINSALQQTLSDIEIILVNDGSEDKSKSIAQKYSEQYARVSLFHSDNYGPGNARNIGIEHASGKYMTFLDADDELEVNAIESMVSEIEKHQSDLVIGKFTMYNRSKEAFLTTGWNSNENILSGAEAIKKMYSGALTYTVWGKIFKTSQLKNILFSKNLWFEDRPFLLEYFLNINTVSFIDQNIIKIYSRGDSITRKTITLKRIVDTHLIFEMEMHLLKKYDKIESHAQLVVNHHLNVLLQTFFILTIDKQRVKNFIELKGCLLNQISKFRHYLSDHNFKLGVKRKIILTAMEVSNWLPWSWVSIVVISMKKKSFQNTKRLKLS